ncbi:DUF5362 family protein [Pedobacter psychroterrae]|uniref:Uncharacterized protein n=1 Tax=Pedobacter psychroterrae TaxID=2530453 RepID=A0A4R0NML5_9SPHI|nr:DUF5362 family protein [Pedobacter psychroterrae]TCD00325.1 hypothetical protein EZ437_13950 [Pedobacter psychroterrae]
MENIEEKEPEVLIITEDIRSYIYETAKWANFLSIVGFVFTALMVLCTFGVGAFMSLMNNAMGAANPYAALGTAGLTVVLLFCALIYFYPSLLLFKYANAAKKAVLFADQATLSIAMGKMKSFFKFWGILMIVVLAFYGLIFLFGIIAGIGAAGVAS